MSYIKDDFLLESKLAVTLYEKYARKMPIFDYHCHISEHKIYEDKEFKDIYEIWLSGDHYKWRLMRNYGVNEEYITGNKTNKEKFITYCATLQNAFGNPLYHWSQVELDTFFNCKLEINKANAIKIWNYCNAYIKKHHISPSKLINRCNVKMIFTTNEIFDDLNVFKKIKNKHYKFKVAPAFRADKIMKIEAKPYLEYLKKLGTIHNLNDLEKIIEKRLKAFIEVGCVASDTDLQRVLPISKKEEANKVLIKRLAKKEISLEEVETFKGYFTYYLLKLYSKYNIRSELHIGNMRNTNDVMFNKFGLDSGFDSMAEDNSSANLAKLMNRLNNEKSLPPMILFNLNPKMNLELLTLMGAFQDDSLKGKIQYGPAWWYLDNKEGMYKHLKDYTSVAHLDSFVGMLTDSRSFLSYPRHHYFRRILCNYLAELINKGECTKNLNIVGEVIKNLCYNNAIKYFNV